MGTRKRLVIDLAQLALPGPGAGAGWTKAPPVGDPDRHAAIEELRRCGVPDDRIDALQARLRGEYTSNAIAEHWPTVGEDRKVLQAAADLAEALSLVLRNASPRAQAELATAAHAAHQSPDTCSALSRQLATLAREITHRAAALPPQTRNKPRVGIVWAVDEVMGDLLPAPTTRPDSRYYRACIAAFQLAGYPVSPDKAILRYVELRAAEDARAAKRASNRHVT